MPYTNLEVSVDGIGEALGRKVGKIDTNTPAVVSMRTLEKSPM
jgi:hypothetical protein